MSAKTKSIIANTILAIMYGIGFWGAMLAGGAIIYGYYIHSIIAIAAVVISILVANKAADYIIDGDYTKSTKRL